MAVAPGPQRFCWLSSSTFLGLIIHPYSAKGETEDPKGKGPDPRSHGLFALALWKREDHLTPQERIGLVGPSGLLSCLPPPSCSTPEPTPFPHLGKGRGMDPEVCRNLLGGEGRGWERLPSMLWGWRAAMRQMVRLAPKDGSQ